jgi:hypothetical protein
MVQSPQITSSSGATALSPAAGKSMRKQAGGGETFASLLDTNSGGVTAASPDSATSAGGVAQSATVPPQERAPSDFQPQAKPVPHAGAVGSGRDVATLKRADGASDAVRTQSPKDEHAASPASDLVFFSRAFLPTGNSGTAHVRRSSQSATDAASSETMVDAKNANQSGSENSAESTTSAPPISTGASGGVAVLAAQTQSLPVTNAGAEQARGGTETSAGSLTSGSQATGRVATRTSANAANAVALADAGSSGAGEDGASKATAAQAGMQKGEASLQGVQNPGAGVQSQGAGIQNPVVGVQNQGAGGQGQVGALGRLASTGSLLDASGTRRPASAGPSTVEHAQGFIVTDVRTHFAPEAQTARSQARNGAIPYPGSAPQADFSALEVALSAGQGTQPVTIIEGAGSRNGRTGGETTVPAPADKPAVQSSEVSPAPATPVSGQATPPPAQQVFDAIHSAMPKAADTGWAAPAGNPPAAFDYQPLKTITIAMQPDGLGTVAIQLTLKSSHIGVRLDASEASTAQLLRQHGGDLTDLLQSAGYTVGTIAVHAASQPAPDTPAQAGAGGQNAFGSANSDGSRAGGGSTGAEGEAQRQPGNRNEQKEGGYGRPNKTNNDSSLYV